MRTQATRVIAASLTVAGCLALCDPARAADGAAAPPVSLSAAERETKYKKPLPSETQCAAYSAAKTASIQVDQTNSDLPFYQVIRDVVQKYWRVRLIPLSSPEKADLMLQVNVTGKELSAATGFGADIEGKLSICCEGVPPFSTTISGRENPPMSAVIGGGRTGQSRETAWKAAFASVGGIEWTFLEITAYVHGLDCLIQKLKAAATYPERHSAKFMVETITRREFGYDPNKPYDSALWEAWWDTTKAEWDDTKRRFARGVSAAATPPAERPPRPVARHTPQALLPQLTTELNGPREIRIRNPNDCVVAAGVRTGTSGKNIMVPAKGTVSAYLPDGEYDVYFVYSDKPDALFQGDTFTLSGNGAEI
jgi:hypothetical protein